MNCRQAKTRLDKYDWRADDIGRDSELTSHLESCQTCLSLVAAEMALQKDLSELRQWSPEKELTLDTARERIEGETTARSGASRQTYSPHTARSFVFAHAGRKIALVGLVAVVAFLTFVPLNFTEQVGYRIAIDGVGKDIAVGNQKITSLLDALGMESHQTSSLLDSLGANQITFSIGECTETCRLTISDLKTERDVRLMIKAIIDLGCCKINGVEPIFKNESTSILEYTAKKLLS